MLVFFFVSRCPKTSAQDILGISDVVPMEEFPVKVQKRVLKRPPVMEDYIKVTSTDGTRVYLVLEDEDAGQKVKALMGVCVSKRVFSY